MSDDDREVTAAMVGEGIRPWQQRLLAGVGPANRAAVAAWLADMNKTVPPRESAGNIPMMEYLAAYLTVWQWSIIQRIYVRTSADWGPTFEWFVRENGVDPAGFAATHDLTLDEFRSRLEPADLARFEKVLDDLLSQGYEWQSDAGRAEPSSEPPPGATETTGRSLPADDFLRTLETLR